MSSVALNGQTPVDLPVKVTFKHAALRQDGDAQVFIPRRSPAHASTHIDEADAFPVTINLGRLGIWPGLAMVVDEDEAGITLSCVHWSRLLKSLPVPRGRTIRDQPAGAIVQQVLTLTFAGLGASVLTPGRFTLAPPLLDYDLNGQDVGTVLSAMQDASGGEPEITDTAVNWLPPLAPAYEPWLCQGVDLVTPRRKVDFTDRLWQVTARSSDGHEWHARALPTRGPWKPWRIETTDAPTAVLRSQAAIDGLLRDLHPDHTWTVGLRDVGAHWASIREGMTLKLATRIGWTETCPAVRVLSRTYTEGSAVLDLELQRLPPPAGGLASLGQAIPIPAAAASTASLFQSQFFQIARQVLGSPTYNPPS